MSSEQALEDLHVHEVYEAIAPHFSATRHSHWPRITQYLAGIPTGSVVADIGCGNGKYLQHGVGEGVHMLGWDRSAGLAGIAAEKGIHTSTRKPSRAPASHSLATCLGMSPRLTRRLHACLWPRRS